MKPDTDPRRQVGHTEDDDTLFLHYGDDDLTGRVSD